MEWISVEECPTCRVLTDYYLAQNPEKKGWVYCEECFLDLDLVPVDLSHAAKHFPQCAKPDLPTLD
jgi:hypothetical protein